MTTGPQNIEYTLEQRLDQLTMTPSQRASALSALRIASDAADIIEAISGRLKKIATAVSPKPSVRV